MLTENLTIEELTVKLRKTRKRNRKLDRLVASLRQHQDDSEIKVRLVERELEGERSYRDVLANELADARRETGETRERLKLARIELEKARREIQTLRNQIPEVVEKPAQYPYLRVIEVVTPGEFLYGIGLYDSSDGPGYSIVSWQTGDLNEAFTNKRRAAAKARELAKRLNIRFHDETPPNPGNYYSQLIGVEVDYNGTPHYHVDWEAVVPVVEVEE